MRLNNPETNFRLGKGVTKMLDHNDHNIVTS